MSVIHKGHNLGYGLPQAQYADAAAHGLLLLIPLFLLLLPGADLPIADRLYKGGGLL